MPARMISTRKMITSPVIPMRNIDSEAIILFTVAAGSPSTIILDLPIKADNG
jgi:hypothetical protein